VESRWWTTRSGGGGRRGAEGGGRRAARETIEVEAEWCREVGGPHRDDRRWRRSGAARRWPTRGARRTRWTTRIRGTRTSCWDAEANYMINEQDKPSTHANPACTVAFAEMGMRYRGTIGRGQRSATARRRPRPDGAVGGDEWPSIYHNNKSAPAATERKATTIGNGLPSRAVHIDCTKPDPRANAGPKTREVVGACWYPGSNGL
jgi:hypothetical protein